MRPTQALHEAGQSIWLDNITRALLNSGTLAHYISEYSLTGLTSNPTILDKAIESSADYDEDVAARKAAGASGEEVLFDIAVTDLRRAADLFGPIHGRTDGVDGWVSLEVSPLLAHDTQSTIDEATNLCRKAARGNLFIKIPGTAEGLPAIEECIYEGIPVNVTLLFSAEHYLAAADAYLRGVERRILSGRTPVVASVASIFVSRWDKAVAGRVPEHLRDRLGIAVAKRAYRAYRELLDSPRWARLATQGARPQRLLWASTSTKDPEAPDVLYVTALAAPFTINTMPDQTLEAFADHGTVGKFLPADGGDADQVLAAFTEAGIDVGALAGQLQREGADAFVASWKDLLTRIGSRSQEPSATG
jgi:transaldolase